MRLFLFWVIFGIWSRNIRGIIQLLLDLFSLCFIKNTFINMHLFLLILHLILHLVSLAQIFLTSFNILNNIPYYWIFIFFLLLLLLFFLMDSIWMILMSRLVSSLLLRVILRMLLRVIFLISKTLLWLLGRG